jgi:hypothetical protein
MTVMESCQTAALRTADQYAGNEHKRASDHDLECRLKEGRVHETGADPGDCRQLDRDDEYR